MKYRWLTGIVLLVLMAVAITGLFWTRDLAPTAATVEGTAGKVEVGRTGDRAATLCAPLATSRHAAAALRLSSPRETEILR